MSPRAVSTERVSIGLPEGCPTSSPAATASDPPGSKSCCVVSPSRKEREVRKMKSVGRPPVRQWLIALLIGWVTATSIGAGEPSHVRELYVPFEDLERVLEAAGQRVFLTRQEYAKLLQQADRTADDPPPLSMALLSARYEVTVANSRAQLTGRILLETTVDRLQAVPLDLAHVGVQRATLDGQPAAIGMQDGQTVLFVSGRGRHELILEMVLPVEVTAARQKLQYRLPTAAAMQWRLVVPGDVEIRGGAEVLQREVDTAAGVTRFELLPSSGDTTLEMTLNNRLAQQQSVVVARQVIVDELTEAYERLHAIASMKMLHGASQRFRIILPDEFEVTRVSTPQMARWEVTPSGEQQILEVQLRSPESGTVVIQLTAERTAPPLTGWRMPQLQPLDVAGCVSAFGLLAEDRLRLKSLTPKGLIPIDTRTLTDRLPPSVLAADPGAPAVRPLAAYYAPQTDYSLAADLEKPPGRLDVTSNVLLTLQDAGLELHGGFALTPDAERIFDCQFSVEPGWEVTEVTCQGAELPFERFQLAGERERIRIALPQGVQPGQTVSFQFHAIKTPDGWLKDWSEQELQFPSFTVVNATTERGGLAVQVRDDLTVRPERTSGVTPLDDRNKAAFNLAEVPTALAYRYEGSPWEIQLHAERKPPRITAETYSFLKIEPGNLRANYEVFYRVLEARTRTLAFLLPETTPVELSIVGLDGTKLKSSSPQEVVDGFRRWDVQLVAPTDGLIHLAVSFQQRLDNASAAPDEGGTQLLKDYPLALIRAADVDYQSGTVAVEGSAELEVELKTDIRKVDVGELVDAAYRPGRRLLGTYGFVGDPQPIAANVSRPQGYHIPEAIVKRGELVTAVSAEGLSQTAARFLLRTKASFMEVRLPAESVVWSVLLDDKPSKPQRVEQRLLISLPPAPDATVRDLRIVYETPVSSLGMRGTITLDAPRLQLRDKDASTAMDVPLADLVWQVHAPEGFRLADSRGTVFPNWSDPETRARLAEHRSAWQQITEVATTGGPWILAARAQTDARARRSSSRSFRQSSPLSEEAIRERERRPAVTYLLRRIRRSEAGPGGGDATAGRTPIRSPRLVRIRPTDRGRFQSDRRRGGCR